MMMTMMMTMTTMMMICLGVAWPEFVELPVRGRVTGRKASDRYSRLGGGANQAGAALEDDDLDPLLRDRVETLEQRQDEIDERVQALESVVDDDDDDDDDDEFHVGAPPAPEENDGLESSCSEDGTLRAADESGVVSLLKFDDDGAPRLDPLGLELVRSMHGVPCLFLSAKTTT
jgi:hypothetical protein